jgi:hypothetical protein
MANAETGAIEWGSGVFTVLGAGTGLTLVPPQAPGIDPRNGTPFPILVFFSNGDRASMAILVNVAATAAFNLDYQFTTDGGATWFIGQQIPSVTVTVDGGVAGYTQSASINVQVGYQYRVQIWNTAGGSLNGAYEWRLYSDNS